MGLLSNKIRREQLNPGDHIYTWRSSYSSSHHGIYVGDGKVIHPTTGVSGPIKFSLFNESSPSHRAAERVVCCSIEEFLSGGDLYLFHYGVSRALYLIKRGGTCTQTSSEPPSDVLHRASSILKEGSDRYNHFNSNCEDFAIYCKTGVIMVHMSKPSRSWQIKFLCAIFLAATLTPYPFLAFGFTSLALVVYGLYCGYHRSVRMENGSRRWSLPVGELIASAVWLLRNYSVVARIGYGIRSVALWESFDDLQRNHPVIQTLGGFAGAILLVLEYNWNIFGSIYLWCKVGFMCGFLCLLVIFYQQRRGFKLPEYMFHAIMVLGFWYWTKGGRILVWKMFVDSYGFSLYLFVSILILRNHYPMNLELGEYITWIIWVLGYWYYWSSESRIHFWTELVRLFIILFFLVPDHSVCLKLVEYTFETGLVLGVWYLKPESIILIWIRFVFLNVFLFKFVLDHLRNRKRRCLSCNPMGNPR